MNARQLKKAFKQMQSTPGGRDELRALLKAKDDSQFSIWRDTINGSQELNLAYQAVDDVNDCLDAIQDAIQDGDIPEAIKLISLSREAIAGHVNTLKGLL